MPDDSQSWWEEHLRETLTLAPNEELTLITAAANGDEEAKRRVVDANLRLVVNIAKTYRPVALSFDDLVMHGTIGLMQAIDRLHPDKGFRFSTYAVHWIRSAMNRAIDSPQKS